MVLCPGHRTAAQTFCAPLCRLLSGQRSHIGCKPTLCCVVWLGQMLGPTQMQQVSPCVLARMQTLLLRRSVLPGRHLLTLPHAHVWRALCDWRPLFGKKHNLSRAAVLHDKGAALAFKLVQLHSRAYPPPPPQA